MSALVESPSRPTCLDLEGSAGSPACRVFFAFSEPHLRRQQTPWVTVSLKKRYPPASAGPVLCTANPLRREEL